MGDTRTLEVERSTATAHRLLEYDGVCGNVHGHNMEWEVELAVSMEGVGTDNMPLDFKDVSEILDQYDHATALNVKDSLVDDIRNDEDLPIGEPLAHDVLGEVVLFQSDPTCELISQFVADQFVTLDNVVEAEVTLYETSKYGMTARAVDESFYTPVEELAQSIEEEE